MCIEVDIAVDAGCVFTYAAVCGIEVGVESDGAPVVGLRKAAEELKPG